MQTPGEKIGNYHYVKNVSYRFNRNKMNFDIVFNYEKRDYNYSVSPENVFTFNLTTYDSDGGKIYNEFVVEPKHLYIYAD